MENSFKYYIRNSTSMFSIKVPEVSLQHPTLQHLAQLAHQSPSIGKLFKSCTVSMTSVLQHYEQCDYESVIDSLAKVLNFVLRALLQTEVEKVEPFSFRMPELQHPDEHQYKSAQPQLHKTTSNSSHHIPLIPPRQSLAAPVFSTPEKSTQRSHKRDKIETPHNPPKTPSYIEFAPRRKKNTSPGRNFDIITNL